MTAPDEQSNRPPTGGEIPFRDEPPADGTARSGPPARLTRPAGRGIATGRPPIPPTRAASSSARSAGARRSCARRVAPELRGQLDDVGREALLTLRSLVDHYLERLDQQPTAEDRVEQIPID